MKLEQQVVSLEIAKKLKDLGVEQKSLWYWVYDEKDITHQVIRNEEPFISDYQIKYSAFTVAELGELLPKDSHYDHCSTVKGYQWRVCAHDRAYRGELGRAFADTEADSRAKMLIYLKEHKLI